jgi:hypothetical protein
MDRTSADSASCRWPTLMFLSIVIVIATAIGLDRLRAGQTEQFVLAVFVHAGLYLAAVWWVWQRSTRFGSTLAILGVAVVMRALAFGAPPYLSTDVYRYIWDGRVQASGINPYRYLPSDPALEDLRDTAIYPQINRRDYAPTIYPPAAQVMFLVATRFGETLLTMKFTMVSFEAIAVLALVIFLVRIGQPSSRVLVYAWHPLPIWEFAGTGHVDAGAMAFLCLSLLLAALKKPGLSGFALAVGALIKPFPVAVAPAFWRRGDWKMPAAALLTVALLYAPYVGVGSKVLGFLGAYGDEEGYLEGSGFYLVNLLRFSGFPMPSGVVYLAGALLAFAALAIAIAFRPRPEALRPSDPVVLSSAFLVLTSPHYAWYFAWAIPFLCSAFYLPLLYMTLASFMIYLPRTTFLGSRFVVDSVIYGGFALLALAGFAARLIRPGDKDEQPRRGG